MENEDVRLVQLAPMRMATALGFGPQPEFLAWTKLLTWAKAEGLDPKDHRFFGFNNPSPSPGSPNYGYEQWMTVGPEVIAGGEVQIKDYAGGLYLVMRCRDLQQITEVWQELMRRFEQSPYQRGQHQWLEECLSVDSLDDPAVETKAFDLYLPVAK